MLFRSGRVEIYNEYGATKENPGVDLNELNFSDKMIINFNIEGIDGNLKAEASSSYKADISYAAGGWNPSYWGGGDGFATVTGNGEYTVSISLGQQASGAVVWTIELYDLWKDLENPELVKVTINSIIVK